MGRATKDWELGVPHSGLLFQHIQNTTLTSTLTTVTLESTSLPQVSLQPAGVVSRGNYSHQPHQHSTPLWLRKKGNWREPQAASSTIPNKKGCNMMVWKEHYLGSQETWIPALSLEHYWHTTLDKAFNLSWSQVFHVFLRTLNEIKVSSSPFSSNCIM